MTEINQSIFKDLEIPTDGMIDPNGWQKFADNVYAAAAALEEVMDSNTTVAKIEREHIEASAKIKSLPQFDDVITEMYEFAEGDDLAQSYALINMLESLTKDLKNSVHDKAKRIASHQNASMANKKLAQLQHKRLREVWKTYCQFVKLFFGEELKPIRPKSGNYESNMMDTYLYTFPDGEEFYNHRATARKLDIFYEGIKFADIMEYCEAHTDEVEVTKVYLK